MVLSVGYNPFYNNTKRSVEVHLLLPVEEADGEEKKEGREGQGGQHNQMRDFYGAWMNLLMLGFVREERGDYSGVEELVQDIKVDMEVARRSLQREAYRKWTTDDALKRVPTREEVEGDDAERQAGVV
jgi:hypothetical protein